MSQFAGMLEERPPYIRFERRAIERRATLEEGGETAYVDRDFALVTAHGSKDTVEKLVDEWFPRLAEEARQGRFNPSWLKLYKDAYAAWKEDQEPPLNGTSIKLWPVASPAEVKRLIDLRILTIEDLAAGNEELIGRIGMGGRSLKQKAVDWLAGKTNQAPLITQLDALRQQNEALQARLEAQDAQIKGLQHMLNSKQSSEAPAAPMLAPVEDRLAAARGSVREDTSIDDVIDEMLE